MRRAPGRRISRTIAAAAFAAAAGLIAIPLIPVQTTEATFTDVEEVAVPVAASSLGTFQAVSCQMSGNGQALSLTWSYTAGSIPATSFTFIVTLAGGGAVEYPGGTAGTATIPGRDTQLEGNYTIAVRADSATPWTVTSPQTVSAVNVGKKWLSCA